MEEQVNFNKELLQEIRLLRQEIAESTRSKNENSAKLVDEFRSMRVELNKSIAQIGHRLIDFMKGPYKWNDLPTEMKLMCVDQLNVFDRFQLWNTSSSDRALVDMQKLNFDKIQIKITNEGASVIYDEMNNGVTNYQKVHKFPELFIEFLFKIGEIDELWIDVDVGFKTDLEEERLYLDATWGDSTYIDESQQNALDDVFFCLGKLNSDARKITLDAAGFNTVPIDQFLNVSSIETAKLWQIKNLDKVNTECVRKVVQDFAYTGRAVGTAFQVSAIGWNPFDHFSTTFLYEFSVVSQSDHLIRLKTEKPKKHVLLEHSSGSVDGFNETEYLRIRVIPSTMTESEYEKDHDDWKEEFEMSSFYFSSYWDQSFDSDW